MVMKLVWHVGWCSLLHIGPSPILTIVSLIATIEDLESFFCGLLVSVTYMEACKHDMPIIIIIIIIIKTYT